MKYNYPFQKIIILISVVIGYATTVIGYIWLVAISLWFLLIALYKYIQTRFRLKDTPPSIKSNELINNDQSKLFDGVLPSPVINNSLNTRENDVDEFYDPISGEYNRFRYDDFRKGLKYNEV